MKKHLVAIALVLSLAMNAGVLGMLLVQWLTTKKQAERHERWLPESRESLGTSKSPELRRQYLKLRQKNRKEIQRSQETRLSFINSLQAQHFDEAESRRLLTEYLKAKTIMERALGESMISIKKGIKDPQTMQAFNARIRQKSVQLGKLANQDSLQADSLHQFRRPLRAKILQRIRHRRGNW